MMMEQQQRLKQQAMMQQALYHHPALLAAPQIEPIISGNLPPGFDTSTCRSVYVGNIPAQATEQLLQEIFSSIGPLEGCKLIRKEKSSYGFVDYYDRRSAALAIVTVNMGGICLDSLLKSIGAMLVVKERIHQVTSVELHRHFHALGAGTIEDVRIQRDKGFGFVRYGTHTEAALAIQMGNAQIVYGKPIKCSWGSKPTPPGMSSTPLPPPAVGPVPGFRLLLAK